MFEDIRERYFPLILPDGIIVQPVGRATYSSIQATLMPKVFPHWNQKKRFHSPGDRLDQVMRLRAVMNKLHREYFIFYHQQTPIGWSTGRMDNHLTFRMSNTGILSDYRRKGIYTTFATTLLDYIKAVGYERIVSYHHPTNRAILNAKLKLGFNITGSVLQEDMGATVQLTLFFYKDRFDAFESILGLEPDFTQVDS